MTARRALGRWGWRTLRREWRQQLLVLSLITTAVAAGVFAALAGFNLTTPVDRTYGNGTMRFEMTSSEDATLAALRDHFGGVGVIADKPVPMPGSIERLNLRWQDPDDGLVSPMLALLDGDWPQAADEIALTDDTAELLNAGVGDRVEVDGHRRSMVGLVENPTDLNDEFALVPADAGSLLDATMVVAIVDTAADRGWAFQGCQAGCGYRLAWDEPANRGIIVLAVYAVVAVAMVEVALLAAAGFAVISRRRLRQYGLIGAIGGTERQIRQAAVSNGLAVGAVGAATGAALAVAGAILTRGSMETASGHRIALALPWWVIVPGMFIAIAAAAAAAWWPSRTLSRQPLVEALAARRPLARPTGRSSAGGIMLLAIGSAATVVGFSGSQTLLATAGLLAAIIGVLLLAPAIVGLIGRAAPAFPLAGRIAGRDLARHQSRSAAALAAIALALGVPVALAVTTASGDAMDGEGTPNLPANVAIAWIPDAQGGDVIPAGLDPTTAVPALERIRAVLPTAAIAPIEVAVDPHGPVEPDVPFERSGPGDGVMPIVVTRTVTAGADGVTTGSDSVAWLASEALLEAFDLDPALAHADTPLLGQSEEPARIGQRNDDYTAQSPAPMTVITLPNGWQLAADWLTPASVAARGWDRVIVGWVIVDDHPLAGDAHADLRTAAGGDALVEVQRRSPSRATFRVVAAAIGAIVALGVLALAVGLIRAEASAQTRTLAAIGAPARTRRAIAAATAGFLALAGAALAVPGGYLALLVTMSTPDTNYPFVLPWPALGIITLLVPAAASVGAWLLSGRQPSTLAKAP